MENDLRAPKGVFSTASGAFKRIVIKGEKELLGLRASSAQRSYTIDAKGSVIDNAAPAYDQQALREAGSIR